jgi:hypothetical protein
MSCKFLRRLLRFRLRTLLIVTTLVCVWLAWHVHRTKEQRQAVAAIREFGGWVYYDYQYPDPSKRSADLEARSPFPTWLVDRLGVDFFHDAVEVNLVYSNEGGKRQDNANRSDAALQFLPALPGLRRLLLTERQASDDALRHVARLRRLEEFFLWDGYDVTDRGAAHLAKLPRLRYVHLSNARLTDASLALFGRMPRLEGLCLQFNCFSDAGLKELTQLDRLESLWVCGSAAEGSAISDEGLQALESLPRLEELGVQHTEVTSAGLERFHQALPGCTVHH